jgi:hypothetical protein
MGNHSHPYLSTSGGTLTGALKGTSSQALLLGPEYWNGQYANAPDSELAFFGSTYFDISSDIYPGGFIIYEGNNAAEKLLDIDGNYGTFKIDPEGVIDPIEFGGSINVGTSRPNPGSTFSGDVTIDGNVEIAATKKLYLDGGSNTYIYESAGDTIKFVAGMGGTALTLTTLQATFSGSVQCGVNFKSSDGTSGANVVRSWEDPARDVHTVTIKDGLITSWVIA